MSTIKSSSYVRFLNLIDALDRMNPGKKLDSTEESLLDSVVLSFYAKKLFWLAILFQSQIWDPRLPFMGASRTSALWVISK
jgi:hypothetical protein